MLLLIFLPNYKQKSLPLKRHLTTTEKKKKSTWYTALICVMLKEASMNESLGCTQRISRLGIVRSNGTSTCSN